MGEVSLGNATQRSEDDLWAGSREGALQNIKIWHFSGKSGLQPWMFLDFDSRVAVVEWISCFYQEQDPLGVVGWAFGEWFDALSELLSDFAADGSEQTVVGVCMCQQRKVRSSLAP